MKKEMRIYYDEEGDYFEMFFGKATKGYYRNLDDGIFQRIDEKTGKTKGFSILGFKKRTKNFKEIKLPFQMKLVRKIFS